MIDVVQQGQTILIDNLRIGVINGRIKDSTKMAGLGDGYQSKALPRAEQGPREGSC